MSNNSFFRTATMSTIAAALTFCAGTSTALGQYDDDWYENEESFEWSPDEGYHEEEWYDPSDWFDDDFDYASSTVDYEETGYDYDVDYDNDVSDGYNYDYDGTYDYDYDEDYDYDDDYDYYDDYYTSYYDGYYDGFYDDDYGFDAISMSDTSDYADGFLDGYYDGYYDQSNSFDYDPYYYVYSSSVSERDKASDRQRRSDETRDRGDRMKDRDGNKKLAKDVASEHRKMAKMRGTIDSMSILRGASSNDDSPMIARLTLDDGKSRVVNLGPKMTRSNLPFEQGDRVTLAGKLNKASDRTMLNVATITVDGQTAQIASRNFASRSGNAEQNRSRDRTNRRDGRLAEGRINYVARVDSDTNGYVIFRVNMNNGSRLIAVDSNTIDNVDDLGIEHGDRLRVVGRERTLDGDRVLVARSISVNGDRIRLSR